MYIILLISLLVSRDQVIIQSVYTTDSKNNAKRVFSIEDTVKIHVVLRNVGEEIIRIPVGKVRVIWKGKKSKIEGEMTNYLGRRINPYRATEYVFDIFFRKKPLWYLNNFEFVGDIFYVNVYYENSQYRWSFYIDEFGLPDSLYLYGNALFVTCLGPDDSARMQSDLNIKRRHYALFDTTRWDNFFWDLKKSGVKTIFISATYYNYGILEGGRKYQINQSTWEREKYIYYWFPTGPERGKYNYTTPPFFFTFDLTNADINKKRERIRNFVQRAHEEGIRVIGYMDIVGIYDPDDSVKYYEKKYKLPEFSTSSIKLEHLNDRDWILLDRSGNPLRLEFVENFLRYLRLRDLNPYNYALVPAFCPRGHESKPPFIYSVTYYPEDCIDYSSYKSFILSQVRWLTSDKGYNFDGIFFDDQGRLFQDEWNISIPITEELLPELPVEIKEILGKIGIKLPSLVRLCDLLLRMEELLPELPVEIKEILSKIGTKLPLLVRLYDILRMRAIYECSKFECWKDYIFGVDIEKSKYYSDLKDVIDPIYLSASLASLLRNARYQIKAEDKTKILISSDYYVPQDHFISAEDMSSTDLYSPFARFQAIWFHETYKSQLKGMRIDINKRAFANSLEQRLAIVALTWANKGYFWFGGDESATDISESLWNFSFHKTKYSYYLRFYNKYAQIINNPNLTLKFHVYFNNTSDEEAEVRIIKSYPPRRLDLHCDNEYFEFGYLPYDIESNPPLYFVLYSIPGSIGEIMRVFHLINLKYEANKDVDLDILIKNPVGLKVKRIRILSPDNIPFLWERVVNRNTKDESWTYTDNKGNSTEKGDYVKIHLKNHKIYTIIIIEYAEANVAPPKVVSTFPRNGDENVPLDIKILAEFNQEMDPQTLNSMTVKLKTKGLQVKGDIEYIEDNKMVVFSPSKRLLPGTKYIATLSKDIRNKYGVPLNNDYSWNFVTLREKNHNFVLAYLWGYLSNNDELLKGVHFWSRIIKNKIGLGFLYTDFKGQSNKLLFPYLRCYEVGVGFFDSDKGFAFFQLIPQIFGLNLLGGIGLTGGEVLITLGIRNISFFTPSYLIKKYDLNRGEYKEISYPLKKSVTAFALGTFNTLKLKGMTSKSNFYIGAYTGLFYTSEGFGTDFSSYIGLRLPLGVTVSFVSDWINSPQFYYIGGGFAVAIRL
jgi:hypothetical protein